jgi:predicted 3-demethylubiquinone-9 3-methyltransferase (glyoxalase superfamily)
MFVGAQHGRAEEAMTSYVSLFPNSAITQIERYAAGEEEPEGVICRSR